MPEEIDYEAELSLILSEMEKVEDVYELHRRLVETLNAMRAEGLPVPEDLARLEATLSEGLTASGGGDAGDGDVPPETLK